MSPCGACGGARNKNVVYEITYKHDGSKEIVDTLAEATIRIAQAPQGGARKAVPKPKP